MTDFVVNGVARHIELDPDTPLLFVLRNQLALKGSRFGCGVGLCGACNVIVDGRAVRSCDTPLSDVAGRSVETIESLATDGVPSALQRAFIECQAGQCGFCLSGILMSAEALLRTNPRPSDAEVRTALDDNLCRCGAHQRMIRAVLCAAEERDADD